LKATCDDAEYETALYHFERGELLLLFTDGIIESGNAAGEFFGISRLKDLLRNGTDDFEELLEDIFKTLKAFRASSP